MSDTSRFVRTVSPLVDDPDVQNALTNRLTATIFTYVDIKGLADQAVAGAAAAGAAPRVADRLAGLTPTLASAVNGFVHDRVAQLVASPQFAQAFDRAVATAHDQMVSVLSGNSKAVVVRNGSVFLDLAPFIDLAKQRLSAAGLTAVSAVPEVHPTVKLASADTLVRAQTAYSTLNTVAGVLPWVVLLMFAVGVYLARRRYRALVGTGLGVALSLVVLAVGLLVARSHAGRRRPRAGGPRHGVGFRHPGDTTCDSACGRCSCSRSCSRWRGTWPVDPTPRCGSGAGRAGSCTGSGAARRPVDRWRTWVSGHVRGCASAWWPSPSWSSSSCRSRPASRS